MVKTCTKCKQEKPMTSEFFCANTRMSSGFASHCRKCAAEYVRAWHAKAENKAKQKEVKKAYYADNKEAFLNTLLKKAQGISWAQYEVLLNEQGGVCFICKEKCASGRRLAVDHCHKTGVIRGLLCGRCNCGIGNLQESEDIFLNAIQYLRKVHTSGLISSLFKKEDGPVSQPHPTITTQVVEGE